MVEKLIVKKKMNGFGKTILLILCLVPFSLLAQTESETIVTPCGASEEIEKSLHEHPELLQNVDELERFTKQYIAENQDKLLDSTITIPVVFHVFHTYGAERISEAQMKDCIRILNEDYQNKNADSSQVVSAFKPIIGRPQMRFRLAKKDPNGRCTKGINYIESSLHTQGGENLKSISNWDTKRYLNIWVCSVVASGAAAYAYYPGSAPGQNNEGIVSRSDYVGSIGTSNNGYNARTLSHESGHYFNLPHTWGNSNTPGDATNCNIDDGVTDTPNCVGVTGSGCNLSFVSCGNLNNVQNHMEYSSCRRMFTKGQVLRMHAAINSNTGFRSSLWKGSNLIFTGTTNDSQGDECPAKVDFKSNVTRACAGQNITFTQLAYNVNNPAGLTFNWSFPGGTPETSTSANPIVSFATAGTYSVKLVVTNAAGKDSLTRSNLIRILPSNPSYQAGDIESFETTTFPNFPSNPDKIWDITSTISNSWKRSTLAAATGQASLLITNNTTTSGSIHTLISPVFEVVGPVTGAKLAMKYAFAKRISTNTDKLVISYSIDCGKTWKIATTRTGTALATVPDFVTATFSPTAGDWKQEYLSLLFLAPSQQFRLKFEFTGGGGNNLFIDDIQLTTVTAVNNLQDDNLSLSIMPNPSDDLPKLIIDHKTGEKVQVEIMDALGRETLLSKKFILNEGRSEINLSAEMEKPKAGSYWVRIVLADRVMVRQWVVLP
jgi:PKD repeat protein